ncbi:hypothetical protein POL68_18755 [Stigmatella sp. ncwal1]|uniref:DUF2157 domain-containing protein n=1 Tax=Stigmatella ashevillensis TaxID=2995309 RepID=A0ABT5DA70_9BACT|nr:hypothetical protein [Stigmatella ashevillena]MDC0710524.1 hypothetical protein [Stigmatella ashevillena]
MYCPECRQERLFGLQCVRCGSVTVVRPREALEAELEHVGFLLNEVPQWDDLEVSSGARKYLVERYERQSRILLSLLTGVEPVQEAPVAPAPESSPEPMALPEPVAVASSEPEPMALPEPMAVVSPEPAPVEVAAQEPVQEEEVPLPLVTPDPLFDAPPVRSLTARLVEEASPWSRIWRPFLYESIGWFLGAFLILAGTLYFVFESWAGMTSGARSLVVFGMTAFYSVGFSTWGAFLTRREALRSAGRILCLIGSAVAPLAGLALGPLGGTLPLGETLGLDGVSPALLVPLLLAWSAFAAFLVRRPAEAMDAPSRPWIQAGMVGTTLMMGLAPLAARLGVSALWLNVLPCVLFFALSRRPGVEPRQGTALVFALTAPLYLLALFSVRLHLALAAAGTPPALGSYAPFIAFLLATCLAFRRLEAQQAADPLALGVAAMQVGCLVLSGTGAAPAFFVTAAVFTWTMYWLGQGALPRLRWLYPAYAGAYLVYASSPQLVPGAVKALIETLKARLGYPPSEALPFQFGALTALPFVLVGVLLASRLIARGGREVGSRAAGVSEVLLRSTAVASLLFVLMAHLGPDSRPALWSALALSAVCVAGGLWLERTYLSGVGALLMLAVPLAANALFGSEGASLLCGGVALVFAVLVSRTAGVQARLFSGAVGVLALAGFVTGVSSAPGVLPAVGMGLAGSAALLTAWTLADPRLLALAGFAAAAAVPKLAAVFSPSLTHRVEGVSPAMAIMALVLVFLGDRGGRMRLLGIPGILYALLAVGVAMGAETPVLGVILLAAAAAVAWASRVFPGCRPLAVLLAGLALLPPWSEGIPFAPWPWLTPAMAMGGIVLWALGASLAAVRWGRSPSTTMAGVIALAAAFATALVSRPALSPMGLMLGAALAALLTARALPASLSVVAAAAYATLALFSVPGGLALLAAVLSVLALLNEPQAVRNVLTGGRRFALAASLSALCVLGISLLFWWMTSQVEILLACTALLPLLWVRANRQPMFAVFSPVLTGVVLYFYEPTPAFAPVLPLLMLLMVRAVEHVPAVAQALLGGQEQRARQALSWWTQAAFAAVGCGLVLSGASGVAICVLAVALALLPGSKPSFRLGLAAVLIAFVPGARFTAAGVLLALGLFEHHRSRGAWAFFRCAPDLAFRACVTWGAFLLAGIAMFSAPSSAAIVGVAGVLLMAAFLLSERWLLTVAVVTLAFASLGRSEGYGFLEVRPLAALVFTGVAFATALLSALCQSGRVQRALSAAAAKVFPRMEDTWSEPLWVGSLVSLVGVVGYLLVDRGPGVLPLSVAGLAALTAILLMVTRSQGMAYGATGALGLVLVAAMPLAWMPVALGTVGLGVCWVGTRLEARGVRVGDSLHHAGWMLSLLAIGGLHSLRHVSTPLSFALAAGAAWTLVHRRRGYELVGWLATLVAVHVLMMHLGVVFSTGRGKVFILPYLGALTAVLASVAFGLAGQKVRRAVGHLMAALAFLEVLSGLVLVPLSGAQEALREGLVVGLGLFVLLVTLVRRAVSEKDMLSAYCAQVAAVLGYLSARVLGMGADQLGMADSLMALVGGVFFSGLYVFVQREGSRFAAFRQPALMGAFLFPLVGLLTAPWGESAYTAALLVGHAAHFAALAMHPSRRGAASLASAVAFNAALLVVWVGAGAGEPQYYVIPAGLSLLVLLSVFRKSLSADTLARLRALAVTIIYVAGAWQPLMFPNAKAMLLCVGLCLLGVGAGIALRIRSYVYLGSAFLVTCVVANLVRFGIRDHRMGAAFLSLLGLMVVGFMVLLSAHRERLLQRYARVRSLLAAWEG